MSTVFTITILIIATCIFYNMFVKNTDFASYTYDEGTNKVFFIEGEVVDKTDSSFIHIYDHKSKAVIDNLVKGRKLKKEIDEIVNKVFQDKNHSNIKCKTTLYPCREDGMYIVRGTAYEVLDLEELKNNKEFNEKISQLNKSIEELNVLHKKDYLDDVHKMITLFSNEIKKCTNYANRTLKEIDSLNRMLESESDSKKIEKAYENLKHSYDYEFLPLCYNLSRINAV